MAEGHRMYCTSVKSFLFLKNSQFCTSNYLFYPVRSDSESKNVGQSVLTLSLLPHHKQYKLTLSCFLVIRRYRFWVLCIGVEQIVIIVAWQQLAEQAIFISLKGEMLLQGQLSLSCLFPLFCSCLMVFEWEKFNDISSPTCDGIPEREMQNRK